MLMLLKKSFIHMVWQLLAVSVTSAHGHKMADWETDPFVCFILSSDIMYNIFYLSANTFRTSTVYTEHTLCCSIASDLCISALWLYTSANQSLAVYRHIFPNVLIKSVRLWVQVDQMWSHYLQVFRRYQLDKSEICEVTVTLNTKT